MQSLLHITNGDSVIGTLREAAVPGTYSCWADPLWEGPITSNESDFLSLRAKFLAEAQYAPSFHSALANLQAWQSALETYSTYNEVVLWFEHDLFDQLNLVRLLDWFARRPLGATRLSLICVDQFLGQLPAAQLAALLPTRQTVTPEQLTLAQRTWTAFAQPDRTSLAGIVAGDTTPLPFLAAALRRFLEESPSPFTGLTRTEEQALRAASQSPSPTAGQLFQAVQTMEEAPFMGDTSFWRVLRGHPHLTVTPLEGQPFASALVHKT